MRKRTADRVSCDCRPHVGTVIGKEIGNRLWRDALRLKLCLSYETGSIREGQLQALGEGEELFVGRKLAVGAEAAHRFSFPRR